MTGSVLFEERRADNGMRVGVARLNAEKTLNALSLDMVGLLSERLSAWKADPGIVVVVLEGTGEKAFCAGGDVQALHKSMVALQSSADRDDALANSYAIEFFSREYRLDYEIHTYPKPVLCWGHGIVMGGGLGLMGGASHRVVTERSRVAMPEVSIGLYPDVGGTWLRGRMPGKVGVFLALTGAPMGASDALFTGVADFKIDQADKTQVFDSLLRQSWSAVRADNDRLLNNLLGEAEGVSTGPIGPVRMNFDLINRLCRNASLPEIIAAITGLVSDDPWVKQGATTLAAGSPSSAALAYALQYRSRKLSLADVFRMELIASIHCAVRPDFAEGVRAVLVDKDRNPRWQPKTHADITQEWIDGYFVSPWPTREHPLADLG